MNYLLQAKNLEKSFPGVKALENANITIKRGEIHGIVGENGAGKSTLIKCICGVHQPDNGEIIYKNKKTNFSNPKDAIKEGIRVVHQEFSLVPYMSVAENIFLGAFPEKMKTIDKRTMIKDAEELLDKMNINIDPYSLVKDLSVAEQQFVEIIKAFSNVGSLMILDEPTAALNNTEVEKLFRLMKNIREKDVGLMFISHRLPELLEICDSITVMKDGGVVGTYETASLNEDKLVSLMVGRELKYVFPDHSDDIKDNVIFDVKEVSSNLLPEKNSFKLYEGEILGFYGLEGQGQRRMLRLLYGLDPIMEGTISLRSSVIKINNPYAALKYGVAYVPPDRKEEGLALNLSVLENLTAPYYLKSKENIIRNDKLKEIGNPIIDEFNIKTSSSETLVKCLSGGNQQKIVIGKWLSIDPKILLLDEPTRGIDVDSKMEIYDILRRLIQMGIGVIIYSSDIIETIQLCDRVLTFYEGKINGELTWQEINEEKIMSYVTGTDESVGIQDVVN